MLTQAKESRMKISARNILEGKVVRVMKGAVNAEVELALRGGEKVVSTITNASVESLGLNEGTKAFAIVKASEVMIGKGVKTGTISARNVLDGVVAKIEDGAVSSEVRIQLPGGSEVVASITKTSAHALGLKRGDSVSAIIKASNVLLGV
jgi:molybdate transport system regulatory protein